MNNLTNCTQCNRPFAKKFAENGMSAKNGDSMICDCGKIYRFNGELTLVAVSNEEMDLLAFFNPGIYQALITQQKLARTRQN